MPHGFLARLYIFLQYSLLTNNQSARVHERAVTALAVYGKPPLEVKSTPTIHPVEQNERREQL